MKAFPPKSGTKQGSPFSPQLFNIDLEVLATTVREESEIKINPGCVKREKKPSLFADKMFLYMESPKDIMIILLELIDEYDNVVSCKL